MRKGYYDLKELEKYKKDEIQALARELGVSDEGTIKDIAARIAEVEVELPDGESEDDPNQNDNVSGDNTNESQNDDLVKVKAIQKYKDIELDDYVEKDTEFEVNKERANTLIAAKVVILV